MVLCYIPGMGKGSAASVASSLLVSYLGVRLALVEVLGKDYNELHYDQGQQTSIYIRPITSADTVMKSGQYWDEIVKREKVIRFEMEGAGVWDNVPCIIIKGVCDYANSHKSKVWQAYAAATGASVAKGSWNIGCLQGAKLKGKLIGLLLKNIIPWSENSYILFTSYNQQLTLKLAAANIVSVPNMDLKTTAYINQNNISLVRYILLLGE
ncbi:hypothetical protein BDW71DRAFT_216189 [Aspergillus fruticulosus]